MQTTVEKIFEKQKLNKEIFRGRAALALLLSCLVVVGVFWWLKLTGITMAGEAFCGFTEHQHQAECTQTVLVCGQEGADGHVHGDGCYEITYTCGLEAHTHDASCYSDNTADLETERLWKLTFQDYQETAEFADNLIAFARTQLGYTESQRNYQVDAMKIKHGYTRYGEWYGNPYGDWSAMFVEFCLYYTTGLGENLPYSSGVETTRLRWEEIGVFQYLDQHTPEPGDILFLDLDGDGKAELMGILAEVDADTYSVILGDCNDSVCEIPMDKTDGTILGATVQTKLLEALADDLTLRRIDFVEENIDILPTYTEIAETLGTYEASGDTDGYIDYFKRLSDESHGLYTVWEDLREYRWLVTNTEQLMSFASFWPMPAATTTPTIYQINYYLKEDCNLLIAGSGTIKDIVGANNSFYYWDMYVVSKDAQGYYVTNIVTSDSQKWNYSPGNGFILLMYTNTWDVKVGDRVTVDCPLTGVYKQSDNNGAGYGSVGITSSNQLTPIETVDTSEFIEINLYNYGDLINTKWNSNKQYPGFQQGGGTTSIGSSLGEGSFNFGDNITADYDAGATVGNKGGAINVVSNGNVPVSGAMNYNLVNGYPALAYTASGFDPSLKWLFSDNPATSTTKVNSSNLSGLFQYDEETGIYYFDSRQNHAQYNAQTDSFDVYAERISPNYLMYPFGNFLPFNDINQQATKVTRINQTYFTAIANAAKVKYNNGYGSEYNTLASVMNTFVTRMGGSFTYLDAVNKYFSVRNMGTGDASTFSNLYNLDYDEPSDFYFGMDIHMNFIMTKDGTTGVDGETPMYFDFNGDDDVWVYVDGKLFLDLSGIHRHVGGRIDFQHGRVEYYSFNQETGLADLSINTGLSDDYYYINDAGKTIWYVPFSEFLGPEKTAELINPETGTFYPYTSHSFDFYYMERGSGSSVCSMEFTLPLLQKNSISVTKEMTSADDLSVLGNPDFFFQVLKPDGVTPFIGADVTYDIYDAATQKKIGSGITEADGIFRLKAGQMAVFADIQEDAGRYFVRELLDSTVFEQYGTVTVDGNSVTKDHYEPELTVGNSTFMGVNSDVKDISDGSTSFLFTNHVDINKYGSFYLTKHFNDYQSGTPPREVTFQILLDGVPIPAGTEYTAIRADGVYEVRTVEAPGGTVTFRSDEILWFYRLLAGTQITLREAAESSAGYAVSYTASGDFHFDTLTDDTGPYGQFTVPAGQASIQVSNDREGTKLSIPFGKTLLYTDGTARTYTFVLQQVAGLTDLTESGIYIKYPITIADGTQEGTFVLNFVPGTPDGRYYYLIYEENADAASGMDTVRYLVEVTVTTADGKTDAQVTGRYLADGTALAEGQSLAFVNRIVRPLTVSKTVSGIQTEDLFTFRLQAMLDGQPLTGTYLAQGPDGQVTLVFTEGEATFQLKHGQSLTVLDLPYGVQWTVTETTTDGYFVRYTVDSGSLVNGAEASGTLLASACVSFTNVGGYELPSTGSAAHLWFIIVGCTLMLLSLVIGYLYRRKAGRSWE